MREELVIALLTIVFLARMPARSTDFIELHADA
jgi:hypothetical protein